MEIPLKKISSNKTFFYKRIFPAFWFGFLFFMTLLMLFSLLKHGQRTALVALAGPCFMMFFGYFLMKFLIFDLADEVYDGGDHLIFRYGRDKERIEISNIKHLNFMQTNPRRITLTLRSACARGQKVSFSPIQEMTLNPFSANPIAEDLINRIDQNRN